MSFKNTTTTLASAVATSGTFTVSYPSGTNSGTYFGGAKHKLFALQTLYSAPTDFTLAFGASNVTVTWRPPPGGPRRRGGRETAGRGGCSARPGAPADR